MNMIKWSSGVLSALALGTSLNVAAGPSAGLTLGILGPTLGANPLPGTGLRTFGIPDVAGLAIKLTNNDGAGHSVVALKATLGSKPADVDPLPGLVVDPIQLGLQADAIGAMPLPLTGDRSLELPGLGTAHATITNNDGAGHANLGAGFTPAF